MSKGLKIFMFAGILIFFSIVYWPDTQMLQVIATFGILILTLVTIYYVDREYEEKKKENKTTRTIQMVGRYTGNTALIESVGMLNNPTIVNPVFVPGSFMFSNGDWNRRSIIVFAYFEELGMQLKFGLIDFEIIYDYFQIDIPKFYKIYKPYIDYLRNINNAPNAFEDFEYMCEKINNRLT